MTDPRHELATGLSSRLADGAVVAELDCGGGIHETRELAGRFELTGYDLSERQPEEAWTGEFLGAQSFFSSFPPEVNSRLVRDAGFEPVRDEVVTIVEPEGPQRFQWVLAQR